MLISEAFSKYKAKQKNVNWSVSAFNDKGELVVSLWEQYLKKTEGKSMTYSDRASRWSGNGNGNKELIKNLNTARLLGSIFRIIIAKTNMPEVVERGGDASKLKNNFIIKQNWIGELIVWDGDNFQIRFTEDS